MPFGVEGKAINEDFLAVSADCVGNICVPYNNVTTSRQLGVVMPQPPSGFMRLQSDAETFCKSWVEPYGCSVSFSTYHLARR